MTGVSAFLFFSQAHNHHNQGRHNHHATIIHTHGRTLITIIHKHLRRDADKTKKQAKRHTKVS